MFHITFIKKENKRINIDYKWPHLHCMNNDDAKLATIRYNILFKEFNIVPTRHKIFCCAIILNNYFFLKITYSEELSTIIAKNMYG